MSLPALLIIDLLNDFFHEGPLLDQRAALVSSVNQLVRLFRAHGLPVVWVRQEFAADLSDAFLEMRKKGLSVAIAGTEGAQLLDDLEYRPGDHEIVKKRYSAFFQTDLDSLLSKIAANPIVLAGVNTHACIRTTAIDAYQRDLEVVLAGEGVASYDDEHHRVSLRYLDGKIARVLSNAEIEELISGSKS